MSEGICEPSVQQLGEFPAFFVRKSGVHAVGFRVFKVYFLVSHIQVAAGNHGLFCVQGDQVRPERVIPFHPVRKPLQAIL